MRFSPLNRRSFLKAAGLTVGGLCLAERRLFAADPVDSSRLPYGGTWLGKVGLIDVDPATYTKHGSTLATSATASDITTALAAAASAGGSRYVELASGTFDLSGDITLPSLVALRGQVGSDGYPSTILNFDTGSRKIVMNSRDNWNFDNAADFTMRTISTGHTRGSSTITLTAAPTGLTAGRIIFLVAPASGTTIDGDGGFTDFLPSTAAPNGSFPFTCVLRVTAVNGNDVTFAPEIDADYISGLTCRIYYRAASNQIDFSGLENLQLQVNGGTGYWAGRTVDIAGANQCWFHNLVCIGMGHNLTLNAFIWFYGSYNCEIDHCDFSGTDAPGNSSQYSISSLHTSGLLVVNSHFTNTSNVFPMLSLSRSAFAYNYCHDMNYGAFQSQWVFHHGSHNHFILLEGNWINGQHSNDLSDSDNFSHSRNTLYFRERIVTKDTTSTTNLNGIMCMNHHDNVTVAGCVIGKDGVGTGYKDLSNGTNEGEGQGYNLNFHANSATSLERFANHNRFDDGIASDEALGAGEALVDSYLYAEKPSWFGDRPWPWVDPNDFTQSDNVENLPAGYRATNGEDPPAEAGGEPTPTVSLSGSVSISGGVTIQ